MESYIDTTKQLQTSSWISIFPYYQEKAQARKALEASFPGPGKIAPFGESFQELASAVALKGKPIAEFDHKIYTEEKNICDCIIQNYGLDKLDDPAKKCVWLFRPKNRTNALKRIAELKNISQRKYCTLEDHKRIGELYGYSEVDIDKFISWMRKHG